MKFQTIKSALVTLLANNASTYFRVVGYQKEAIAAEAVKENLRLVQVFYQNGQLTGVYNGSPQHDMNFKIVMTVSAPNKADLTVLDSETATAAERIVALGAARNSESIADDSFDDLASRVWNIVKGAQNRFFGITDEDYRPANLYIKQITKDEPIRYSNLTVITGNLDITCRIQEDITGIAPIVAPVETPYFYEHGGWFFGNVNNEFDTALTGVQIKQDGATTPE